MLCVVVILCLPAQVVFWPHSPFVVFPKLNVFQCLMNLQTHTEAHWGVFDRVLLLRKQIHQPELAFISNSEELSVLLCSTMETIKKRNTMMPAHIGTQSLCSLRSASELLRILWRLIDTSTAGCKANVLLQNITDETAGCKQKLNI